MSGIKETPLKRLKIRLDRAVPDPVDTPEHLFKLPGVFAALAKRGSGKTTAVASLLRDYKQAGLVQRVWLISPNSDSPVNKRLFEGVVAPEDCFKEPTWGSVGHVDGELKQEAEEWYKYKAAKKVWARLQGYLRRHGCTVEEVPDDLLLEAYEHGCIDRPPTYKYGDDLKWPCFWLILDDCQGTRLMSSADSNPVNNLSIRNRHVHGVGLNIVFLCQSYSAHSGLQRFIRDNCTVYMLWRMASESRRAQIADELANDLDKTEFLKMYQHCTYEADDHSFMTLDMQAKKGRRYRKRFDTLVALDDGNFSEQQIKQ